MKRLMLFLIVFFTLSVSNANRVTLVEYFDYNCPVCRGFAPTIHALKERYPNLKLIQRVVPVIAPSSLIVDSVILATRLQGKFKATQNAVLNLQLAETIPYPVLINILHNVGVNIPLLNATLLNSSIQIELKDNLKHYAALNIHQVPVVEIFSSGQPRDVLQFIGSQPYYRLQQAIQFFNNNKRK